MVRMIYRAEVEFGTHDSVKRGETGLSYHRVLVEAPNWQEAQLTALQMVSCVGPARNWRRFAKPKFGEATGERVHETGMPTACHYVE
jgi:hypothetical protein